jgi:DNA-binding Xre family transcriptional regulator
MRKRNLGSHFDKFLEDEDLLEEASATAVKRIIAQQIAAVMKKKGLSKAEMARRMDTSRAALDRLLDPDNDSVTLQTLQSAAHALGGRLKIQLQLKNKAA